MMPNIFRQTHSNDAKYFHFYSISYIPFKDRGYELNCSYKNPIDRAAIPIVQQHIQG
ncbi:unnamed protein product, partial [Adineta steineri]